MTAPDEAAMGDDAVPAKTRRSYSHRAQADLNRARKSLGKNWTKTDERFDFYLAEANVLALLDLADAIRSTRGAGSDSE